MLLCGENVIFAPTSRNLLSNKLMTNLLLLGFLPSGSEWIIIALVILLLFGGKKIPELMRGLGKGVKSFKYNRQIKKFPTEKQNVSLKHILT